MKFKNFIKIVLISCVLIAVLLQHAKAQEQFTLNEAIEAALEYNYDIRIQLMDAEIAGNLATHGNAGLLPFVGITSELKQSYGSVNLTPGSFFRDLIGKQGSQVPAEINYDGVYYTTLSAGIGSEMVLYSGRAGQIRYRLLQTGQEAAILQNQERIGQTVLEITGAYIQTALYQETLKFKKEILKQSREHYLRLKEQRRHGQASKQQFLQAQTDLKSDSTSFRDLKHQLENAWRDLHYKIGWSWRMQATLNTDFSIDNRFELQDLLDRAQKENRLLQLAELQTDISVDEINLARSSVLPTLSASARYGYNYQYTSEGQFETMDQLGVSGGITLRIPLFQGGQTSTAIQNAKIEHRKHEIKQKQARDQVNAKVENQLNRFNYLIEQVETKKLKLSVYERNYERANQAYRHGLINSLELRNAQLSLFEVQMQISNLSMQLKMAESELLYLTGELISLFQSHEN